MRLRIDETGIKLVEQTMISGKALPRYALLLAGAASISLAALGLIFNWHTLFVDYSISIRNLGEKHELNFFYPIFYTMSGICITFYFALVVSGIQLIRKKTGWTFVLLAVAVLEVLYFITVGILWAYSSYNYTIAAASGISSGGLMYQAYSFFPLWAPTIALWARKKIIRFDSPSKAY